MIKDNKKHNFYISGLIDGVNSLLMGTKTTMTVFYRRKTAEQCPENRKILKLSGRFKGTLTIPHNERNKHHCVAYGLCRMTCPNDTIRAMSETIETGDGKKKKILAKYEYDLGSCTFCQLYVNAYPHDAITFDRNFEHAIFDRSELMLTLSHPGSHIEEKKKSAAPQVEVAK